MSRTSKAFLILTGLLAALLVVGQLVMGLLILRGRGDVAHLIRSHYHSGLLTVVVTLVYIAASIVMVARQPAPPRAPRGPDQIPGT
ncbi:MAG TPA: hypothetical protein VF590_05095 [Isosphaeraceae bacterium]|jgi:hypothetical protein